jgi:hypothetical protein
MNDPKDNDPSWHAKFDLDGDGKIEDTAFTWDDDDKVLYAFADTVFKCRNGGEGAGGLLVAVRPDRSGFYVAELEAKECGAGPGLWGCTFDAAGTLGACGPATLDAKNDTIKIAVPKP